MPAALLIVVGLGAITIDAARSFQAQREAVADAQSIAHDVVSAVSVETLRTSENPWAGTLDQGEVRRRIATILDGRPLGGSVTWELTGDTLRVTIRRRVPLVFSGAMPGLHHSREVVGRASAVLVPQEFP